MVRPVKLQPQIPQDWQHMKLEGMPEQSLQEWQQMNLEGKSNRSLQEWQHMKLEGKSERIVQDGGMKRAHRNDKRTLCVTINKQILSASDESPQVLVDVITEYLPRMNVVNISTALHRLAKTVGHDTEFLAANKSTVDKLLDAVAKAMQTGQIRAQALSNITWSFAMMRLTSRVEAIEALVALALQDIRAFKAFELSSMVWAFAKLISVGVPSSPLMSRLFSTVADYMKEDISQYDFRCLATVSWAFATARQHNAPLFRCFAHRVLQSPEQLGCQEMSNVVWSFATVSFHQRRLFAALAESALKKMDQFKPQELSNILWGFATMNFWEENFYAGAHYAWQDLNLGPQHVANTLWAYARVQPAHALTRATVLALLPSCTQLVGTFKTQEACSVALSIAKVIDADRKQNYGNHCACLMPPAITFLSWLIPWMEVYIADFSDMSICNMANALASIGWSGGDLAFDSLEEEAARRICSVAPTTFTSFFKCFVAERPQSRGGTPSLFAVKCSEYIQEFGAESLSAALGPNGLCGDALVECTRREAYSDCPRRLGSIFESDDEALSQQQQQLQWQHEQSQKHPQYLTRQQPQQQQHSLSHPEQQQMRRQQEPQQQNPRHQQPLLNQQHQQSQLQLQRQITPEQSLLQHEPLLQQQRMIQEQHQQHQQQQQPEIHQQHMLQQQQLLLQQQHQLLQKQQQQQQQLQELLEQQRLQQLQQLQELQQLREMQEQQRLQQLQEKQRLQQEEQQLKQQQQLQQQQQLVAAPVISTERLLPLELKSADHVGIIDKWRESMKDSFLRMGLGDGADSDHSDDESSIASSSVASRSAASSELSHLRHFDRRKHAPSKRTISLMSTERLCPLVEDEAVEKSQQTIDHWRISMKNSFLHVDCDGESDDDVKTSFCGNSSVRSSSAPRMSYFRGDRGDAAPSLGSSRRDR